MCFVCLFAFVAIRKTNHAKVIYFILKKESFCDKLTLIWHCTAFWSYVEIWDVKSCFRCVCEIKWKNSLKSYKYKIWQKCVVFLFWGLKSYCVKEKVVLKYEICWKMMRFLWKIALNMCEYMKKRYFCNVTPFWEFAKNIFLKISRWGVCEFFVR